jgi:hypothetical protein
VDARAREAKLSAEARLDMHRSESKPVLDALWAWMEKQREAKCIEPNSGLGKALEYERSLWPMLTRFTEIAGVPLDNNICERLLKLAIRHRRTSMFYKTMRGAEIGDIYMTLFHTARAAGVNAQEYLLALINNAEQMQSDASAWLPWNYRATLANADPRANERPVGLKA